MNKKVLFQIVLLAVVLVAAVHEWRARHRPLAERLVSVHDDTRNLAMSEIPKLDEPAKIQVVDDLLKAPSAENPRSRRFALYALRKLGGPKPEIISVCVAELFDADKAVREEASVSLMDFGAAALPALFQTLKTSAPAQRQEIVPIIEKSGEKTVPLWTDLFNSNDPALRLIAAESLEKMGHLDKKAAPVLAQDLLKGKESYSDPSASRPRLARLLESVDPRRRELIDLGFDLKQPNVIIRYRAAYVLSEMNPPTIGALEMLTDALQDKDIYVAGRSALGLARLGAEKTERLKKIITPRLKNVITRAQAEKIEGVELLQELNR